MTRYHQHHQNPYLLYVVLPLVLIIFGIEIGFIVLFKQTP